MFTLAITVAFASVAAACGSNDASGTDGSENADFATTTLPPLAPENTATPAQGEAEHEAGPAETTTPPTAAEDDAPVTTLPPDPAPTETTIAVPTGDTSEGSATTVPVATGTTPPATTDAPTTTPAPTTAAVPATTAAPTTTTAKSLTRQEILDAAADNSSKLQPNADRRLIEVLNVADGSITSLVDAVDGDRPVLLWFWAPH